MKLIERPNGTELRKLLSNLTYLQGVSAREMAYLASEAYIFCCEYYEKEIERLRPLIDNATQNKRLLRELQAVRLELIAMREEKGK